MPGREDVHHHAERLPEISSRLLKQPERFLATLHDRADEKWDGDLAEIALSHLEDALLLACQHILDQFGAKAGVGNLGVEAAAPPTDAHSAAAGYLDVAELAGVALVAQKQLVVDDRNDPDARSDRHEQKIIAAAHHVGVLVAHRHGGDVVFDEAGAAEAGFDECAYRNVPPRFDRRVLDADAIVKITVAWDAQADAQKAPAETGLIICIRDQRSDLFQYDICAGIRVKGQEALVNNIAQEVEHRAVDVRKVELDAQEHAIIRVDAQPRRLSANLNVTALLFINEAAFNQLVDDGQNRRHAVGGQLFHVEAGAFGGGTNQIQDLVAFEVLSVLNDGIADHARPPPPFKFI